MLKQETVDRALQEIGKGWAQYQYFFDRLNSPSWLAPLFGRGFFKKPPEPVREGKYISFQIWPESKYLVRMASVPAAQAQVLEIALQIPPTENSRVHDDLADIALALPPAQSATLVPQARAWLEAPNKLLLPDKITKLIVYLADGGQGEAALEVAGAALALGPDPDKEKDDDESLIYPEPVTRLQKFYYGSVIESSVFPLVRATGLRSVEFFCDLLDRFISLSRMGSESSTEDFLYHRQVAIEDGRDQHDLASVLICAVRDASEQLIQSDGRQFDSVIETLGRYKWSSFRRIELHLARVFPESGLPLADRFFEDPESMNQASLQHEAVLLLQACFPSLSLQTQTNILAWMDQGPREESLRRWLEFIQQPTTDESIRDLADGWRRDHLATIKTYLPPAFRAKYEALVAGLGEERRLEEPSRITGGAFGPQATKSVEDLSQMDTADILSFLGGWTPGTDMFSPTAEGLGRNLATVVAQRPDDFSAVADRFKTLDPTYVRSFLAGLTDARKQGKVYRWPVVLDLAEWVVSQPREIPGRKGGLMVADPDWGWTRDAIIDLLKVGFENKPGRLQSAQREFVWRILAPLAEDPNPSPGDESGPHFDPVHLSINSTRGRAFYALIQYGWWVRECTEEARGAGGEPANFDEMPELRDVLTSHLDTAVDATLTIRAVYGQSLPAFGVLGPDWLRAKVERILPQGDDDPTRFAAAWESFVVYDPPNSTLLPIILPAYQRAVRQLGKPQLLRQPVSPDSRLADHLMVYYWAGILSFGGDDGLMEGFYSAASDEVRGHASWFVGTSISRWGDEAPPEAFERLRALFERRLASAKGDPSPSRFVNELANFGYWFVSGKFEVRWGLDILLSVLRLTKKVRSEMAVVKQLADLCPTYPVECVECLGLMIEGDQGRWLLHGIEADTQQILNIALKCDNAQASTLARRVVEGLIARGYVEFRTLLN